MSIVNLSDQVKKAFSSMENLSNDLPSQELTSKLISDSNLLFTN